MPAAVNSYLEDSDIAKVVNIQKNILEQYRMDITKYAYTGKDKIHDIFDALPSELEAKNRRFVLTDINKNAMKTVLSGYLMQELHSPAIT